MNRTQNLKQKNYKKGLISESLAAWYLRLKGYTILARRYKTPVGEIDIIAKKGTMTIFAEVKARDSDKKGLEAITANAQRRISRAAKYYFMAQKRHESDRQSYRFDVIVISGWSLSHLQNAWQV